MLKTLKLIEIAQFERLCSFESVKDGIFLFLRVSLIRLPGQLAVFPRRDPALPLEEGRKLTGRMKAHFFRDTGDIPFRKTQSCSLFSMRIC